MKDENEEYTVDVPGLCVDKATYEFWSENRDRVTCVRDVDMEGKAVLIISVSHPMTGDVSALCLAADEDEEQELLN